MNGLGWKAKRGDAANVTGMGGRMSGYDEEIWGTNRSDRTIYLIEVFHVSRSTYFSQKSLSGRYAEQTLDANWLTAWHGCDMVESKVSERLESASETHSPPRIPGAIHRFSVTDGI
jgi:hypothetical protein